MTMKLSQIPLSSIGDGTEFVLDGTHGSPVRTPTGIPVLSATNVKHGSLSYETGRYTSREEYEAYRRRLDVRSGDVLLTIVGTIGRTAVVEEVRPHVFQRSVAVLRPRPHVLDSRYLFHALNTVETTRQLAARTNQSAQGGVYLGALKEIVVPTPPLPEQRRIADVLDKADAIRRKRQQAIGLSEELLRSAFLDMFGDPVTNSKGWPLQPLAKLGRIVTGNTPSRAVSDYFGDDIEWIKSDNINTPTHYLTRATEGLSAQGRARARTVPVGSTLVTCIAGSPDCIGNVALADREVAFNQQINAVTPYDRVDYRFLYVLLLVGKRLVQAASTNSMKGMVSKGKLEDVLVPSPPPKAQAQFGEVFDRVLRLSRRQQVAQIESQTLFDTTVQRAFSGELAS